MKSRFVATLTFCAALAACDSGDININPSTSDNSTDNSVSNSNNTTAAPVAEENPCASYVNSGGQTIEGDFDGKNCTYSPAFADAGNNITTDITIPELPAGGVHVFSGSLFVGEAHSNSAELAAAGIAEGGDGPTLTIEAGATLAWPDNTKFVIINRGSQLFAVGTKEKPITFTATKDAVEGAAGPEEVQLWGGMVINGFGVSNKCEYTGTRGDDLALVGECNIAAEGAEGLDESYYGGANDDDSSGRLEYVVVKHTGAQVANGDELNGISFGGVGRNTIIKNLQVYSTYDDGIEMFGGAVNFENFVAVYVRDDSIDVDEGYIGSVTNALVIQQETDGNRCVEADGIGSYSSKSADFIQDMFARGLNSRPSITGLTCIFSPSEGTHDPGAGLRLREGLWPTISGAVVFGGYGDEVSAGDHWAIRVDDTVASDGFVLGNAAISDSVFAAVTKSDKSIGGDDASDWLQANSNTVFADLTAAVDPTQAANTDLILFGGNGFYSVPVSEVVVNDASLPEQAVERKILGAVAETSDWTAGWTFGLDQTFWFQQ